jgi:hypothetical protein
MAKRVRLQLEALEERAVPTVYHVTTTADSGPGSLRAAINAADNNPGPDKIVFNSSLAGQTITLTSGELIITDDLSINGLGAGSLTISGANNSRVFENQAVTTISGLTITGGNGLADNPDGTTDFDGIGGGILNLGSLTLRNSAVADNSTVFAGGPGGGIFNYLGTLIITDTTLAGNTAVGAGAILDFGGPMTISGSVFSANHAVEGTLGGGIVNTFGSVTVSNCTFVGNTTDAFPGGGGGEGGAIANNSDSSMTISGSTLVGNSAADTGGGIFNEGTMTVRGSILSSNSAAGGGAVINTFGTLNLTDCTLSNNFAAGFTDFFGNPTGGGAIESDVAGTVVLDGCVLSGNSVGTSSFAAVGGAIDNFGTATVTGINSILLDNSATGRGAGIFNSPQGTVTVVSSTLSGNSAGGDGGGIYNGGVATVSNSFFIGNSASSGGAIYDAVAGMLTVSGSAFSTNTPDAIFGSWIDAGDNSF